MIRESKYLIYESIMIPKRKTPIIFVKNKTGDELGQIKFYPQWRKFVFFPKENTLFDSSCLEDIIFTINILQKMWYTKEDFK